MTKPNIILIHSHDTGRRLGCYGFPVDTPNIDSMADNGIRFDNYFCPAPQCSPSRGSMITGLYPHNNGMIGLTHYGFSIRDGVRTLPGELKKAGYESALIGFHHEAYNGSREATALGYDREEAPDLKRAAPVADKAVQYLKEKAKAQHSPFYASIGFVETHRIDDTFNIYDAIPYEEVQIPPYMHDTEDVRRDLAHFHGSAKALDTAIGRILKTLDETGLAENTLVIYTTDHGIAFPRAKGTLTDAGLETALIMYSPKQLGKPRVQKELLCNVDLMPTLLEWIDADVPEGLDGQSFVPLLKGESRQIRDEFFCEMTWHCKYHPTRGIRTEKYKYIKNFEAGPATYIPMDIHRSLDKQTMEKYYVPNVPEELYDLESDPHELSNLAEQKQHEAVLLDLRGRVQKWMEQTEDPLLNGPVPGTESPAWEKERKKGTGIENIMEGLT